ncbi:hypothetical protein [Nostoc sp. PA-18-2419]|uniref:hypothetical protein n=1 Tax=Nostoc sp. PA-18-2419 TaxID=2575443 RepID=UPI001108671D|nr:hypothetical protein [Nostoc sp. PA-18-2419]
MVVECQQLCYCFYLLGVLKICELRRAARRQHCLNFFLVQEYTTKGLLSKNILLLIVNSHQSSLSNFKQDKLFLEVPFKQQVKSWQFYLSTPTRVQKKAIAPSNQSAIAVDNSCGVTIKV